MKRLRPLRPGSIRRGDQCAGPRLRSEGALSCAAAPRLWIENVSQAVAEKIEAEHCQEDSEGRKNLEPLRLLDLVARLRQHAAPARIGRADSKAEERQRGFG